MRRILLSLTVAAAAALATPASAQSPTEPYRANAVAPAAGVVAGTVFGLSVSEGWWGGSFGAALPATTAGAAALGGAAGIGTMVLVEAATTPCRGFHALFSGLLWDASAVCENGRYVGYRPEPPMRRRR